jgi:hypothetical protein
MKDEKIENSCDILYSRVYDGIKLPNNSFYYIITVYKNDDNLTDLQSIFNGLYITIEESAKGYK